MRCPSVDTRRCHWPIGPAARLRPESLLIDDPEGLGDLREDPDPGLADDDEILDADAELAGQIDAGLHRDDGSGLERVLGPERERRRLVDLEADPVPEAVTVVALVAGAVDDVAHGLVDLLAVAAGADLVEPDLLGAEDERVGLAGLRSGLPHGNGARAVRAVAREPGAPVDHDQLTPLD